MPTWDSRYTERVKLLVEMLPVLAKESRFALKGGTAINLFERDLPRLSVDIDLAWLPIGDFSGDSAAITAALQAIGERLSAPPHRLLVQHSGTTATGIHRLIASRNRTRVQIETTPVMRGTVHPTRTMRVHPIVEKHFGFAEMPVVDFKDLYAGKLCAALSRQHPRDLFDLQPILDQGRIDQRLWRTFLVYLVCSPKPAAEMLFPKPQEHFTQTFTAHFQGMTRTPVTAETLLDVRAKLLVNVADMLDESSRAFLESVEREAPDFKLIELPQAADLPGVRRKLANLANRSAAKRNADLVAWRNALAEHPRHSQQ